MYDASGPPRWTTYREAAALCIRRRTLRRTVPIALVVGTLLTAINLGSVIVGGQATGTTWVRAAANYLVPLVVSTLGYLSATRSSD